MFAERRIWCAHPIHDEILPNGKKKCWKSGVKPTHPKGKRSISSAMAAFINRHDDRIGNEISRGLSEGDFLCSSGFAKEELRFTTADEEKNMDAGNTNR